MRGHEPDIVGGRVIRLMDEQGRGSDGATSREAPDRGLLAACRRGETSAWAAVVDRYERLVFSIPLRYGLSREDAADVTQSTFTALMQGLDGLRDQDRLAAWLATVARRQTWRLLDRSRREFVVVLEGDGQQEVDPIEGWERAEWLYRGLETLDAPCRELLTALYLDPAQPSYAEAAARLHRPVGSIGPTRARCLSRLREVLDG